MRKTILVILALLACGGMAAQKRTEPSRSNRFRLPAGLAARYELAQDNLLATPEPLLAEVPQKTAGITQAGFFEGGLANGLRFPAAAQTDYAYLMNHACLPGQTYNLSVYVVMADGSAPRVGPDAADVDFSLVIGGNPSSEAGITVTWISGAMYRVSWAGLRGGEGTAANNGIVRYATQSGKGFRATGYMLSEGPGLLPYANNAFGAVLGNTANSSLQVWRNLAYPGARANLLAARSEPLPADVPTKTAGITQASFSEGGLANGLRFPAAAQLDYAYLTHTVPANTALTVSVYVVMDDGSAPSPGGGGGSDFRLKAGDEVTAGYTVTQITGALYRVSAPLNLPAPGSAQVGVVRYAAQSGKGFRVTGYMLNAGTTAAAYERTPYTDLQRGANTAAAGDGNDPAAGKNWWSHVADDYGLSLGTFREIGVGGHWTMYLAGQFDGTSGYLLSLANPDATNQFNGFFYSGAGSLKIYSQSGAAQGASPALAIPGTSFLVLALTAAGGNLELRRLDTGASVSLANTNPAGEPRLGLGALAHSAPQPATSLKSVAVAMYGRAMTTAGHQRVRRYHQRQMRARGLIVQ